MCDSQSGVSVKVKYASSVSVIILCRYLQLSSRHMRELNRIASKLLFGRYSYISIFLSPSIQHPSSLTRFQCWSFEITTSFMNSCRPCSEALSNLLTAISCPFGILPCVRKLIRESAASSKRERRRREGIERRRRRRL